MLACKIVARIFGKEPVIAYSAKTEHSLRMSGALFRQERIIALLVNKVTCFLHVYRDLESLIDML